MIHVFDVSSTVFSVSLGALPAQQNITCRLTVCILHNVPHNSFNVPLSMLSIYSTTKRRTKCGCSCQSASVHDMDPRPSTYSGQDKFRRTASRFPQISIRLGLSRASPALPIRLSLSHPMASSPQRDNKSSTPRRIFSPLISSSRSSQKAWVLLDASLNVETTEV